MRRVASPRQIKRGNALCLPQPFSLLAMEEEEDKHILINNIIQPI